MAPAAATKKAGAKKAKATSVFVVDCTKPVEDKIMEVRGVEV